MNCNDKPTIEVRLDPNFLWEWRIVRDDGCVVRSGVERKKLLAIIVAKRVAKHYWWREIK